jgi:hypothetical protein
MPETPQASDEFAGRCVVTRSPELLLAAARLLLRPLPAEILATTDESWAVPLSHYGPEVTAATALQELAGDLAAKVAFKTKPQGIRRPIAQLLQQTWRHEGDWRAPAVRRHNMRYILGVTTAAKSRQLFDGLTAHRVRDIFARPLDLERISAKRSKPSYAYFWLIRGEPPLSLMRIADRVWREASLPGEPGLREQERRSLPANLFFEAPFGSDQTCLLQNVEWGESGCFVLLGPSEPTQIILDGVGSQPEFVSLAEFADLKLCEGPEPERPTLADHRSLDLRVGLRIVRRADPKRAHQNRINDLRAEIKAKERILEALELRGPEINYEDPLEPLHVHFSAPNEVPAQLERLLLEWSDQPHDLGSLFYRKVSASDLGNPAVPMGSVAHLVTTRKALTGIGTGSLGVRLRDYRPKGIPQSAFYLMPEWNRFQLKVFIPECRDWLQQLEVYPVLAPSELAAEKLARALRIPPGSRQACCVLATSTSEGRVRATVVPGAPGSGFVPLVAAFQWNCQLDVETAAAQATHRARPQLEAEFHKALEKCLVDAAGPPLQKLVEVQRGRLQDLLNQVEQIGQRRAEAMQTLGELEQSVTNLAVEIHSVASLGRDVSGVNRQTQSMASAVQSLEARQRTLSAAIQHASKILEDRR